jgi:hypothetical protein
MGALRERFWELPLVELTREESLIGKRARRQRFCAADIVVDVRRLHARRVPF